MTEPEAARNLNQASLKLKSNHGTLFDLRVANSDWSDAAAGPQRVANSDSVARRSARDPANYYGVQAPAASSGWRQDDSDHLEVQVQVQAAEQIQVEDQIAKFNWSPARCVFVVRVTVSGTARGVGASAIVSQT